MKISILLPYKENFSPNYAGAVSIFVRDTVKYSKYYNTTHVFGQMNYKNPFLKKYINIKSKKNIFESASRNYVEEFIKKEKSLKSDIIEIHNRPNYIKYLKNINSNLILYFHNDPLSMTGSKTVKDRIFLLNKINKILFNSKWSQKRFFIGIDNEKLLKQKTSICYQSTSRKKIDFKNKKKIISFVGKLNTAKGYDLFGNAIIKILSKYPEWKATVIGDEPRENIKFDHPRLDIKGYTNNEKVLKLLEKISISIVCSRWEEPFGRTSLEAASRGSAVIISNKGGLPETTSNSIVLSKLTSNEIFKVVESLILSPKKLLRYQKLNYQNFIFDHKYISNLIDNIRSEFLPLKSFYIKKDKSLKIMHITNFNERFNGRLHYNTSRRLNNGFIRNNHNVLSLSDRDILHYNKSFRDITGNNFLQKYIIENFDNFKPDIIILGHADKVSKKTLEIIKEKNKNLKIAQWFLDPLSKYGPDHLNNKRRILDKVDLIDSTFLTTDPKSLQFKIPNSYFMPNPCDKSFEILSNYQKNCTYDVFFAMSHGVHRGQLKTGKYDDREKFINKLINKNNDLKFDVYGMNNVQPIWGNNFISKISNSYMGINLSRGKPIRYYSSDRIVQLIGNGLLTFIDKKTHLNDFFSDNEVVFYNDIDDLSEKLNQFKVDKIKGKEIAKKGKSKYLTYFNSDKVTDFILSKTFSDKGKYKYLWD